MNRRVLGAKQLPVGELDVEDLASGQLVEQAADLAVGQAQEGPVLGRRPRQILAAADRFARSPGDTMLLRAIGP